MSSPLEQAGAVKEPSEYATISMDRHITGLWTQRSPLRDADVPYLYGKFYSASRFDSLIDGINREMTARLTMARRAGSSRYNTNTFPGINSFYPYKRIVNGAEVVRVIADGQDGVIYDATAGQKTSIFTKSGGAGKARFQGVNQALYFTDGVENKKWLQPGPWASQASLATTSFKIGTLVIDSNGKIQYLNAFQVGTITNVQITCNTLILTFSGTNFNIVPGMSFIPTGLGFLTAPNGQLLIAASVTPSGGNFIVTAQFVAPQFASHADSGVATTGDVGTAITTGGSVPTWNVTTGGNTTDGLSTWTNFGLPVFDWGPPSAPNAAPLVGMPSGIGAGALGFWQPLTAYVAPFYILAPNGLINSPSSGGRVTGTSLPRFSASSWPAANKPVSDGGVNWVASNWLGGGITAAGWIPSTAVSVIGSVGGDTLVDNNGNLQIAVAGAGSTGAGAAPTWATSYGGVTVDNGITWSNKGPYLGLAFAGWKWGYAFHCIDGSLSTLSPLSVSSGSVLAAAQIQGYGTASSQVDSIWIFRTADGQPTPVFLAAIPNPGAGTLWTFVDQIQDALLIPQLPAPRFGINNPPPVGMTAPVHYLGRMWAIYQNTVIFSGGPDTLVGNGNTAWGALSFFPLTEQPIRLVPITVANGGLLIIGTSNVYIIMGKGTAGNPFTPPQKYMSGVGIASYDAMDLVGSTLYMFTGKGKAVSMDPSAGYVEYGFPIGDQFLNVTTGAGAKSATGAPMGALYNPASTYVAWAEISSGDTAVYLADGAVGFFRYSPVASPESGYMWSPRAVIVGGTSAVQAVETSPGITQLLIAPPAGTPGPILFRDPSVKQDWSSGYYQSYPSYDVKGNIVLCQSGEVAEIAHIGVKSAAVGARPAVGLLLGEIAATSQVPFDWLSVSSCDPPDLPPSETLYSDRYTALQNGVCPKCDNFQLALDYGTQNAADETLVFSVYGAKHSERRQQ